MQVLLHKTKGLTLKIFTTSTKTRKGEKKGFFTLICYMSPEKESKRKNLCPWATPGCSAACLGHSAGRMAQPHVQDARERRTDFFLDHKEKFLAQARKEIRSELNRARKNDMSLAVRFNGSTDIPIERIDPDIFDEFPDVYFYDYTKSKKRALEYVEGKLPRNYHLTFSYAETKRNQQEAREIAAAGGNVAIVFRGSLPSTYWGLPVIDGDETDLRFLDTRNKNVIVGLKAKGAAKHDQSGFVVDPDTDAHRKAA